MGETLTDDELRQIRERWCHAPAGPWAWTDLPDGVLRVSFLPLDADGAVPTSAPADWGAYAVCVIWPGDMEDYEGEDIRQAEAIAAAPTDVALLLGEVDRLRQRVGLLEQALDAALGVAP